MVYSILFAALATTSSAARLYAASYAGTVTTLDFTPGLADSYSQASSASLKTVSASKDCNGSPSWLELDKSNPNAPVLYCVDEGNTTPNASFNTLSVNKDGSLKRIFTTSTLAGPVSSQFYNKGANSAVALAHYGGGAISTFLRTPEGKLSALQNITFNTPPGPRPEQEKSHVHEAIIDPTGEFLLFPDLGADVVHVYCADANSKLIEHPSIKSDAGSGPRHATFWRPNAATPFTKNSTLYLFVIHELGNKVTSYAVKYTDNGPTFTKIQDIGLYGDKPQPAGTRAAEIVVSPDNQFIIASNRNATIFTLDNPDKTNSTKIPSDSLTTFKPSEDGKLTFQSLAPSGGSFPRHFSLNKDGSFAAVGNQNSENVAIFKRDPKTGAFGDRVATVEKLGQVTNVIWDEDF